MFSERYNPVESISLAKPYGHSAGGRDNPLHDKHLA